MFVARLATASAGKLVAGCRLFLLLVAGCLLFVEIQLFMLTSGHFYHFPFVV